MSTRLKPKEQVDYVASVMTGQNSGTSIAATIPASGSGGAVAAGQRAIAALTCINSSTIGAPAGWTPITDEKVTGDVTNTKYRLWEKVLTAGDINVPLSWSLTGASNAAVLIIAVYKASGGYSIKPAIHVSTTTEALNNRDPRSPSVISGPKDRIVMVGATYSYVSTNANSCLPTATPPGMTLRHADSRQQTALVVPRGLALWDGQGGAAVAKMSWDTNQNVHWSGVILSLSPVAPRWTESERVPSTLVGANAAFYTSSSNAYVRPVALNMGYNTRTTWGDRIAIALGGSNLNYALPGACAEDICAFMHGTKVWETRAVDGDPLAVSQDGTWTPGDAAFIGMDAAGNNIVAGDTSTQAITSLTNAMVAMMRRLRSGAIFNTAHASWVETGTWTAFASDGVTSGGGRQTTVPGSRRTITVTDVPELDIVVLGTDNVSTGGTGSTYAVRIDSTLYTTGTTHNEAIDTTWGVNKSFKFVQKAIKVTGIPPGTHEVSIEHTGASGATLIVDSWQTPSSNPPWILPMRLYNLAPSVYTTLGINQGIVDTINGAMEAACASVDTKKIIFYNPTDGGGGKVPAWDTTNDVSDDGVHQSETGMEKVGHGVLLTLPTRIA